MLLVVEDKKAVILRASDPDSVIRAIPTARRAKENLVVVPHKWEETRVLRNLGYQVPAPMLYQYSWPGKFVPYEHQKLTSAFLTMHKKALVLNAIGTGKTASTLWAADYLMQQSAVKRVLIVSPLSTLERVWADAIFDSFHHRKYVMLYGTAEKRLKLVDEEADFFIINHDGLPIIVDKIKGKFDLVIVDEAAVLRNPSTTRFRAVRKYMDTNPDARLWLMTGTPTPNEPTDAWALAKLVGNSVLTTTYTGFRDLVMMKAGKWRYVPKPSSPEIVAAVLHPSIRFTREECLDLPDTVFQTKTAQLSATQLKAYKDMIKHLVAEAATGAITAANEAVKMQKLIQIACGVAYDENGQTVELDCTPRLNILKETIEEADGKVIIFVPLTGVLHMLERELSKDYTIAVVNGEVAARKRADIFKAFQDDKDPKILLAHPATMAHGLTLTSASTIVWYGPITSNEQYVQANGRIERIGKNKTSVVVHLEATDLERKVFGRLKNKQKLQGVLLDILGEQ